MTDPKLYDQISVEILDTLRTQDPEYSKWYLTECFDYLMDLEHDILDKCRVMDSLTKTTMTKINKLLNVIMKHPEFLPKLSTFAEYDPHDNDPLKLDFFQTVLDLDEESVPIHIVTSLFPPKKKIGKHQGVSI